MESDCCTGQIQVGHGFISFANRSKLKQSLSMLQNYSKILHIKKLCQKFEEN